MSKTGFEYYGNLTGAGVSGYILRSANTICSPRTYREWKPCFVDYKVWTINLYFEATARVWVTPDQDVSIEWSKSGLTLTHS
jgi:cell division inhibitor SulA